jgi:hypothetical protein
MLRLISDQNFSGPILRGLHRRIPHLDLVRALDLGLDRAPDPVLLEWAATDERIVLTHDVNTMPAFAYDRVRSGLGMPGLFLVDLQMAIGRAIDELDVVIQCSTPEEWKDLVTYFPL